MARSPEMPWRLSPESQHKAALLEVIEFCIGRVV
jgi:hypothetical protein